MIKYDKMHNYIHHASPPETTACSSILMTEQSYKQATITKAENLWNETDSRSSAGATMPDHHINLRTEEK